MFYVKVDYLTVDTTPPSVTSFQSSVNELGQLALNWVVPAGDYSQAVVRYSTTSYPTSRSNGMSAYTGEAKTKTLILPQNQTYYFSLWVKDTSNNWSSKYTTQIHYATDYDSDGVPMHLDGFPYDPAASEDADNDGYPDVFHLGYTNLLDGKRQDAFVGNATEWADSDGDGTGDNADVNPSGAHTPPVSTTDSDSDSVYDVYDAFTSDSGSAVDTDGDAYPDSFFAGVDELSSGIGLDAYPEDQSLRTYPANTDVFPVSTANLVLHLDGGKVHGDQPAPLGELRTWLDYSKFHNEAVQHDTASKRPTLESEPEFDGKKVVTFSGDDVLSVNNLGFDGEDFTLAAVVKRDTVEDVDQVLFAYNESGSNSVFQLRQGSAAGIGKELILETYSGGTWQRVLSGSYVFDDTDYKMIIARKTGAVGELYVNGRFVASANVLPISLSESSTGVMTIGSKTESHNFFEGSIAEVSIFDRAISDTERVDLNYFLNLKWKGPEGSPRFVVVDSDGDGLIDDLDGKPTDNGVLEYIVSSQEWVTADGREVWLGKGTVTLSQGQTDTVSKLMLGSQEEISLLELSNGDLTVDIVDTDFGGSGIRWTGGTLRVTTVNKSLINEGGTLISSGNMFFSDDYAQRESATLHLNIDGTNESDYGRMNVSKNMMLGGTLKITLGDDVHLQKGDEFLVLNCDGVFEETFSAYDFPVLGNIKWDTSELYTRGVLKVYEDVVAPALPYDISSVAADEMVRLNWTNPDDTDLLKVIVLRSTSGFHLTPGAPEVFLSSVPGAVNGVTDMGLAEAVTYNYSFFVSDDVGNWNSEVVTLSVKTLAVPPALPTGFSSVSGNSQLQLSWVNPSDADFDRVMIRRSTSAFPTSESEGDLIYAGSGTTYTDTTVEPNGIYYYSIFASDTLGHWTTTPVTLRAWPWKDGDYDGFAGPLDAFSMDPSAYLDADGDGYPDAFFLGYVKTLDGKRLDQFLGDGAEHTDSDGDGVGDNADTNPLGSGSYSSESMVVVNINKSQMSYANYVNGSFTGSHLNLSYSYTNPIPPDTEVSKVVIEGSRGAGNARVTVKYDGTTISTMSRGYGWSSAGFTATKYYSGLSYHSSSFSGRATSRAYGAYNVYGASRAHTNIFRVKIYTKEPDSDGDGVANSIDAFSSDPASSNDTDADGYPNSFYDGYVQLSDGKGLDHFPDDASLHDVPVRTGTLPVTQNLVLWLNAQKVHGDQTVSDGPLQHWLDYSRFNNEASQVFASQLPSLAQDLSLLGEQVMEFDGVDDTMAVKNLGRTGNNLSVFMLVKRSHILDVNQTLLSHHLSGSNSVFQVRQGSGSGAGKKLIFETYNGTSTSRVETVDPVFDTTDYLLVTIVKDGAQGRLYVNGYEQATVGSVHDVLASTTNDFYIGAQTLSSNFFKGKLSDLMVYDGAVSDTERAKLHYHLSQAMGLEDVVDSDGDGLLDRFDYDPANGEIIGYDVAIGSLDWVTANQALVGIKRGDIIFSGQDTVVTLNVGSMSGFTGDLLVSGGDLTVETAVLGENGTGYMAQSGGRVTFNSLMFGQELGAHGTYLLTSGRLDIGTLEKGNGSSTLSLNGGDVSIVTSSMTVVNTSSTFTFFTEVVSTATFTAGYTNGSGATLRLRLKSDGVNDRVVVNGAFTLSGTLALETLDGFVLATDNVFQLFRFDSGVSGDFSSYDLPDVPQYYMWDTSSITDTGIISVVRDPDYWIEDGGNYLLDRDADGVEDETDVFPDDSLLQALPAMSGLLPRMTDLSLWLDGNSPHGDVPVLDNRGLQTWVDLSPMGHHVIQNDASRRPTYNELGLNAKGILEFDGVDDVLGSQGSFGLSTQNFTLFVVVNKSVTADSSEKVLAFQRDVTNNTSVFQLWSGGEGSGAGKRAVFQTYDTTRENAYTGFDVFDSTDYVVLAVKKEGDTGTLYVNGNESFSQGQLHDDLSSSFTSLFYVGARNEGLDFWNGSIAEIVLYEDVLDDSERVTMEDHFAAKWGLTLDRSFSVLDVVSTTNTTISVLMDSNVWPDSVSDLSRYAVSDGVNVVSASLAPDNKTVQLTTSPMAIGEEYVVTVSVRRDNGAEVQTPNTIFGADSVYVKQSDAGLGLGSLMNPAPTLDEGVTLVRDGGLLRLHGGLLLGPSSRQITKNVRIESYNGSANVVNY